MSEIDTILRGEIEIRDGHICAFNLAERVAELQLGHVLPAGKFGPARFSNDGPGVDRCATGRATNLCAIADMPTPGTGMSSLRKGGRRRGAIKHSSVP